MEIEYHLCYIDKADYIPLILFQYQLYLANI